MCILLYLFVKYYLFVIPINYLQWKNAGAGASATLLTFKLVEYEKW